MTGIPGILTSEKTMARFRFSTWFAAAGHGSPARPRIRTGIVGAWPGPAGRDRFVDAC
jgi:hypothetical protein